MLAHLAAMLNSGITLDETPWCSWFTEQYGDKGHGQEDQVSKPEWKAECLKQKLGAEIQV